MMTQELIIAGFGGQGVMSMGQLLAYAAMLEGKKVTFLPSYGPEMRGGTANCTVVISDEAVGSPVISDPSTLIAMNLPSLDRFELTVRPGGFIVVNSSLIERKVQRDDVTSVRVPANDIAQELGNLRVANMVALGAYLGKSKAVGFDAIIESLKKALPARRHDLIPLNRQALERGAALVEQA